MLHMVEGLVAFREDASVGADAGAKASTSREDGKTYTFTLREGVKFHNGATMTSDDVRVVAGSATSIPRRNGAASPEFDGRGIAKVEAVEAPDADTVVITLDKPTRAVPRHAGARRLRQTAILHRDSLGADGKWIEPVGTGPFKLGEWKRGQYIELMRFDDYCVAARAARRLHRRQEGRWSTRCASLSSPTLGRQGRRCSPARSTSSPTVDPRPATS